MRRSLPLLLLAGALTACSAPATRPGAMRVEESVAGSATTVEGSAPPGSAVRAGAAGGGTRQSSPDLIERTRAREDELRTLRAQFVATTRHDGELRESEGALVVAKPDRFRMRLLLPFGLTAADVGVVGSRTWVFLPQSAATDDGSKSLFPEDDLRAIFLRGDAAWPGRCRVLDAGKVAPAATQASGAASIECRESSRGPVLRTARVDRGTLAVREESSFDGTRPRTIARHDDLRSVDGFVLPYRITLQDVGRGLTIEIRVVRYEVNPTLAPELFDPPT